MAHWGVARRNRVPCRTRPPTRGPGLEHIAAPFPSEEGIFLSPAQRIRRTESRGGAPPTLQCIPIAWNHPETTPADIAIDPDSTIRLT